MPNDPQSQKTTRDDPRQAVEAGDPQHTGRIRGHVSNQDEDPNQDRTNPDAGKLRQDRQDGGSATTPHRESGDRA